MKGEPRRTAERHGVARLEAEGARRRSSRQTADPEEGVVAERQRDDRSGKLLLVAVLMQPHSRRLVVEIDETRLRRRRPRSDDRPGFDQRRRHRRPAASGFRMRRLIAVAAFVGDPAERPAVAHHDRERLAGARHPRPKERRLGQDRLNLVAQRLLGGAAEKARKIVDAGDNGDGGNRHEIRWFPSGFQAPARLPSPEGAAYRKRPIHPSAARPRASIGRFMAGPSQFKNIMHRKGKQNASRSKRFSKLAREITVAAKLGLPDPGMNARLRAAVLAARAENMPKDNIDRAIKKATAADTENYDEVRYEGYAPGGVAVIVEALTDNRNRTAGEVRSYFTKAGGALAETRAVAFMFDHLGHIEYRPPGASEDALLAAAIQGWSHHVLTS